MSHMLLPQEKALSIIVMGLVSAWVGEKERLQLPWKCFVCVVSLSMLMPLAVNLGLQVCIFFSNLFAVIVQIIYIYVNVYMYT